MPRWLHWTLVIFIVGLVVVAPIVYYRADYAHAKRLRVIVPGKLYRSGQMTAEGFRDAIRDLGIKTVVNLQDDVPSPDLQQSYFNRAEIKEIDLCRQLRVNFVFIAPDTLLRDQVPPRRPEGIEKMLEVFDNADNYPILIHCRAGLHRTGCMAALYRMEYQGWTPEQAVEEMKDLGFGDLACTAANDYVYQYVLTYQRGLRRGLPVPVTRSAAKQVCVPQ
jgi:tyrosine-protein phosphatase SIW14